MKFYYYVVCFGCVVIGFLIGLFIDSPSGSLSQEQRSLYYHGFYDECANITIRDLDTGKEVNRSPERCAQIVQDAKNNKFLEHFYRTPVPTANAIGNEQ